MLIAPNAFKGSLSATQAARAMALGVRRAGGAAVLLPLADGGDGTLDLALANARLERGADILFRLIGLEKEVRRADVVMTGEGRVDRTSWEGKALGGLAQLCRRHNKPLIVLAGEIGRGGRRRGVRMVSLGTATMSRAEKMRNAQRLIANAAAVCP